MTVNPTGLVEGRTVSSRMVSIGVHEEVADPAGTRSRYPAARIGREFIQALRPGQKPAKVLDELRKFAGTWRDGGVYVSYKPEPHDVATGRWTGLHRDIGYWLADHPWVGIIVHHEPEGGDGPLDGATFRAVFNRSRDEIKAGWSGSRVAYCAMAYQWRPGGVAAKRPGEWRRVVADEYLCDVYSGKTFSGGLILPEHPGYLGWFTEIVRPRLVAGEDVTYGLGERGFMGEDAARAATIRRERAWLDVAFDRHAAGRRPIDQPPSVYLAWSSPGHEKERRWVLTGDSAVAMRELTSSLAEHVR
jgi:hypothetical protein